MKVRPFSFSHAGIMPVPVYRCQKICRAVGRPTGACNKFRRPTTASHTHPSHVHTLTSYLVMRRVAEFQQPLLLVVLLLVAAHTSSAARLSITRTRIEAPLGRWSEPAYPGFTPNTSQQQQTHSEQEPAAGLVLKPSQHQLNKAGLSTEGLQASGLDADATVFGPAAEGYLPHLHDAVSLAATDPSQLDVEWATRMGRLTSVAYCSDSNVIKQWTCSRCQRVPQFKLYEVVFDQAWDLMAYIGYDSARDAITLAFRGTDSRSWGNWINNLKAWRQNRMYPIPGAPRAMVHAGFYDLWTKSSLQTNFTVLVGQLLQQHPTPRLFVTGHSMGAALGSLAALDLKFKFGFNEVRMWTFGSPRVGNAVWAQLFSEHVTESWRFTHNRDVVPSLPPQIIGFHHVTREAWAVDVSGTGGVTQKLLICDDTGEDPSCHNSACMLGLCTSVADHLVYLGVEMYRDELEC